MGSPAFQSPCWMLKKPLPCHALVPLLEMMLTFPDMVMPISAEKMFLETWTSFTASTLTPLM